MSARTSGKEVERLKMENSKLKAENRRLKQQASKKTTKKSSRSLGKVFRKIAVIFLISAAVAVLTVANLLFWFGNTAVKHDRFVAATQPIIKDPVVQDTMALYTTNNIFANVDVQKITEEVLPPRADFLAPQLTNQLKGFTQKSLQKALASPKLQDKWNETTARQHERVINFASKYQGDADISVNEVFKQLTASLSGTKLSFLAGKELPPKVGDIKVISAPWLPAFHNVVVHIDMWRFLAILLLIVLLGLAVWLSQRRRRTIFIFALASASTMLATLVALHAVRDRVVSKVDPQYSEGVRHIIQIVFHSLVIQTVTILVAALAIFLIAWISGPSRGALRLRTQTQLLFSGKLHSRVFASDNTFTMWVQRNKRLLQWLVVAFLAVIMLLTRLTLLGIFLYLLLMLVLVLVIELIGGQELSTKPNRK
jgi:hypothetical protein